MFLGMIRFILAIFVEGLPIPISAKLLLNFYKAKKNYDRV